jgi:hypothetical protein
VSFGDFDSGNDIVNDDDPDEANNADNDILNMIKNGMPVKEHFVDLDLTKAA